MKSAARWVRQNHNGRIFPKSILRPVDKDRTIPPTTTILLAVFRRNASKSGGLRGGRNFAANDSRFRNSDGNFRPRTFRDFQLLELRMVPLAGLEPALLAEPDFESGASTNSAKGATLESYSLVCGGLYEPTL